MRAFITAVRAEWPLVSEDDRRTVKQLAAGLFALMLVDIALLVTM